MASKSKKFRICVAGDTVDGRVIEPKMLIEAVETFNPQTYGVRLNVEHFRGMSGDKPFGMIGDIVALHVQDDEITIAGKTEKRTCLYAEILPNDRAVELNKAGQKVYTSAEFIPDFAKSGKFGLVGVAVTDSPASLGTSRLQFSVAGSFATLPHEVDLKFDLEAPTEAQAAAVSAFSAMRDFFTGYQKKPEIKQETKQDLETKTSIAPDAFAAQIMTGLTALSAAIEAASKAQTESLAKLSSDLTVTKSDLEAFKNKIEQDPAPTHTFRAPAAGGRADQSVLSDF